MITSVVLHQYSPAGSSSWDSWTSVGIQGCWKSVSHCYSTVTASVVEGAFSHTYIQTSAYKNCIRFDALQ